MRRIAILPVYREIGKIGRVVERFDPKAVDQVCLVVDDPHPSILNEIERARTRTRVPVTVLQNPTRKGVGYAIKQGYEYARAKGFDIIIVMAGNGKDDPVEIPRLTRPIEEEGYDYVQGSRFLPGGKGEKTPFLRGIFIRLFPYSWTLLTGVHCTEVTNGFRAYRATLLQDPRINLEQSWLDGYELEYYLHYKVLTLGYKFIERPVSKTYVYATKRRHSHISPVRDGFKIVGPLLLLRIGARH